jgi:hypothetical protein
VLRLGRSRTRAISEHLDFISGHLRLRSSTLSVGQVNLIISPNNTWAHGENAENAQEQAWDREVTTGGDVEDGGGTELIASQDEPHGEEPAIAHAPADEEEEQGLGEWAAEEENEEHEEDEQMPATEAGVPEGINERVSADSDESFLS